MEWEDTNNRVIDKLQGMGWYNTSELQPYKEEAMDKVNKAIFDTNAQCCDIMNHLIKKETMEEKIESFEILESHCDNEVKIEFDPSKFEIVKRDDGYYVVKKQPQYPKTYEECCKVLFPNSIALGKVLTSGYNCELLKKLGELLICRDAYWKIAGEQMGLGKPWEPNWLNKEQDKFVLYTHNNVICSNRFVFGHNVFAFPTAEMRDIFFENFKGLIKQCKELL